MLVRLSTAIAAICMLSGAALAQGAAKPTDSQIAHIAYTAGQLDIDAAKQAISKSTNEDVRAFAEDMVGDHTAVNKQALDLVKKLKVTPKDNDTGHALTKAADKRAELSKLDGAEFDKAYIANEVAYHQTVNGALETTLIPSASNPELRSLLQTGLKIFQGHQQHAEEVAAALKRDQLVGSQTQSQSAVEASERQLAAMQAKIQELNSEKDQLADQIAFDIAPPRKDQEERRLHQGARPAGGPSNCRPARTSDRQLDQPVDGGIGIYRR